jgi:iron complex outermembrane receptor protein
VTTIATERIQAGRAGITLDEVLTDVPGVFVNNRYNFALGPRITLRGYGARAAFGVRGIRLIMDGIPLTMPDGQSNLNNIDLTSVGRIDVLRGAASMLYGNAAGGAIDLHSEQPRGLLMEGRAIGATDYTRFNARVGDTAGQLGYLVSAARAAGSGTRDHARFEQNNLTARLLRGGSAFTLSIADAPVAQNPGALPRDSVALKPTMAWPRNVATGAGERSRQMQAGLTHEREVGRAHARVAVFGLTRTLDNPLPFGYITLDRKAYGARAALTTGMLTVGVDLERQSDQRAEFDNVAGNPGSERRRDQQDCITVGAPFARIGAQLGGGFNGFAGARYDRVRFDVEDHFTGDGRDDSGARTLAAFSPALGITWTRARGTVFANVSTSFQTPTTTELINTPPASGQPCCPAGLNALEPERALSLETGYRGRVGPLLLDVSLYQMTIADAIVPFQVVQVEGRDFFRNAGRARHRGLELAASSQMTRAVAVTASYTYSDFIFLEDGLDAAANEGNRLPGIAPHHLHIRSTIGFAGVLIEPEADITASYYADDANSAAARNDGGMTIDLRLRTASSVGRTGLMPFAAVHNLTDRQYSSSVVINAAGGRFFEPAPGRTVLIGLALRLDRDS